MNAAGLAVLFCFLFEGIQQPHLLIFDCWLVGEKGSIQYPLLVVTPDLSGDGGCFGVGDGVIPPADAIDEMVSPINTKTHLHHAVVVA